MILIALGANISGPGGPPLETLEGALRRLGELGIEIECRSMWYQTSPLPASNQPDFFNGVISVKTDLGAEDLLATLHGIENEFGRTREVRWEARTLDLDLLAYHDLSTLESLKKEAQHLLIPHPRLQDRRFVLEPLAEIAPDWCHPTLRKTAKELLIALCDNNRCKPLS